MSRKIGRERERLREEAVRYRQKQEEKREGHKSCQPEVRPTRDQDEGYCVFTLSESGRGRFSIFDNYMLDGLGPSIPTLKCRKYDGEICWLRELREKGTVDGRKILPRGVRAMPCSTIRTRLIGEAEVKIAEEERYKLGIIG